VKFASLLIDMNFTGQARQAGHAFGRKHIYNKKSGSLLYSQSAFTSSLHKQHDEICVKPLKP
jgi:hypothetical protein